MDVPHSVDDDDAQRSAKLIQRLWRGRFARTDLSASDALWRLANVITEASTKEDGMVGTPGKRKRDFRRQHSQRDTKNEPKSPTRARDRPLVKQPWSTVSVARRLSLRKANSLSKKSLSQSSMSQSNGDLGVARTIDDLLVAPLVYRLVSLNADKAWGTGKLVQLAEKSNSDEQLAQEISVLLPKLWRDDPIRTSVLKQQQDGKLDTGICSGETWADVLLEGRGTVGETVLHLVFLLNTPACRRLVRFLVPYLAHKRTTDVFGHKVCALDATYLGQLYFGEVAAHFAIVHEDLPMLKLLVSHGASLTPRACGDFFYSNPLLYFGGTLLGFAACLDNKPMVEYLLNNEFTLANPNGKDQGQRSQRACATKAPGSPQVHMHRDNTILHCLVLHERAHMYRYLVEHGANTYSPNSVNQTPMLLAVAKGSKRMVSTAIEATQILRWTFGPVKCVEVPLYEVESVKEAKLIAEEGTGKDRGTWMTWLEGKGGSGAGSQPVGADRSEQTKTILQLIDRPEQSDLLYIEILWKVVKGKWDCFAGSIFLYFVILNAIGLISQTLALCTALEGDRCTGVVYLFVVPVPIEDMRAIIGDAAYATTLLLSLFLLCRELTTSLTLGKTPRQILHHAVPELVLCLIQWYAARPLEFPTDTSEKLTFLASLGRFSLPFRFQEETLGINRLLLGISAGLGWVRFMRTAFTFSPHLGPKFRMVQRMLVGDVAQWLALYLCFFCACQALLLGVMLYNGNVERNPAVVHDGSQTQIVLYVAKLLFEMSINPSTLLLEQSVGGWPGRWDPTPSLSGWLEVGFTWVCLLFWTILGNIVLLNLLIAMMGNTYVEELQKAASEWRLSFCQVVLFQEATSGIFLPPLKAFNRHNRPENHVRGMLDVRRPNGAKAQVECWFLYVEVSTDAGEAAEIEKKVWREKQKEAAKQRWHEVEDEDLTDAPLDVKIGAAVDLKLRPMQQMLENLCQINRIEPVLSHAQPLHSSPSHIRPPRSAISKLVSSRTLPQRVLPIRTDDGAAAAVLNGAANLFERRRAAAPFGELVGSEDDSAVAGPSQWSNEDPFSA